MPTAMETSKAKGTDIKLQHKYNHTISLVYILQIGNELSHTTYTWLSAKPSGSDRNVMTVGNIFNTEYYEHQIYYKYWRCIGTTKVQMHNIKIKDAI